MNNPRRIAAPGGRLKLGPELAAWAGRLALGVAEAFAVATAAPRPSFRTWRAIPARVEVRPSVAMLRRARMIAARR